MEENKAYRLARIMVQVRLKNVTDEDRAYLNDWLDESAANRAVYKRIVRGECIARRIKEEERIRETTDYRAVALRIIRMLQAGRRRRLLRRVWLGGAAAACMAGVGFFLYLLRPQAEGGVGGDASQVLVAAVPEEDYDAVLVLGDGSAVDLYAEKPDIRQGNVTVTEEEGRLVYREDEAGEEAQAPETEVLNKVMTGRKSCALTLGDGTRVWLNGNSQLEYPVRFLGGERVVSLRGEAYFEVAKDAAHPFIVRTESLYTKVLGTSFNIKAYAEEQEVSATLLEGSVEVSLPDETGTPAGRRTLVPGMQARISAESPAISVREVVAEDAVAWREGKFVFTDEDMVTVLHTLARWYGVTFIREQKGRAYTFSGMVSRDDQFFSVLDMLTLAGGPRFVIDGNNVYIKEK